jgi:NADH-quinone oxidoreductase subunit D
MGAPVKESDFDEIQRLIPPKWRTELVAKEGEKRWELMVINMGPAHPATHGTVRFLLQLEGETVVKMEPQIGYLHRGFEKNAENACYLQIVPYTDRLNYASPMLNNVAYALAVEKLLDIQVPERCQYIRMLISELARIMDHLTCIAATGLELGAFTVMLYAVQAREELYFLQEYLTGARLTTNYVIPGGVKNDMQDDFEARYRRAKKVLEARFHDIDKLLTKNKIFLDRTIGTGYISREDAIDYGFTGPCLRSTGCGYDVRRAHPYLLYDRVEFEVPVGTKCDNYDRYLIRMEEIRQSQRIIDQVFKQMQAGPVCVDDPSVVLPPKQEVYNNIEAMMNHFKLVMEGIKVPPGEIYAYIEGGNGELGFYIVADGSGKPYRIHLRPPCFALMQAVAQMSEGHMLADIIPTFDAINLIGGEIDR